MRGYNPQHVPSRQPSGQVRRAGRWHTAARAAHGTRSTGMARQYAACAMGGVCGRDATTARAGCAVRARCVPVVAAEWLASRAHNRGAQQRWLVRSAPTKRKRGQRAHARGGDSAPPPLTDRAGGWASPASRKRPSSDSCALGTRRLPTSMLPICHPPPHKQTHATFWAGSARACRMLTRMQQRRGQVCVACCAAWLRPVAEPQHCSNSLRRRKPTSQRPPPHAQHSQRADGTHTCAWWRATSSAQTGRWAMAMRALQQRSEMSSQPRSPSVW